MIFNNPLFIIPVLTGLVFSIAGFIMLKFPPKRINGFYGYRTTSSMKNQERWDFAQTYSSKEMIKMGFLLVLCGLIGLLFKLTENSAIIIGLGLMVLLTILLFYRVESAIKKKFPSEKI